MYFLHVYIYCIYVSVRLHVWPHSSQKTTVPQRDGIRQPMNEPTKVVSTSLLHSSFETITFILMAECAENWWQF